MDLDWEMDVNWSDFTTYLALIANTIVKIDNRLFSDFKISKPIIKPGTNCRTIHIQFYRLEKVRLIDYEEALYDELINLTTGQVLTWNEDELQKIEIGKPVMVATCLIDYHLWETTNKYILDEINCIFFPESYANYSSEVIDPVRYGVESFFAVKIKEKFQLDYVIPEEGISSNQNHMCGDMPKFDSVFIKKHNQYITIAKLWWKGFSINAIAEVVHREPGTVNNILSRTLRRRYGNKIIPLRRKQKLL